jgi:hypothetical protein
MATTPKSRIQKSEYDLTSKGWFDHAGTQGEYIGIIVFAAVHSSGMVITHGSPDTTNFIRNHAAPNPSAIDDDPAPSLAFADFPSNCVGKIRVIH